MAQKQKPPLKRKSPSANIPRKIQSMNVANYGTLQKDYRLWVDIVFEKFGLHPLASATILGLIAFFTGLLLSFTISFEKEYLTTFPVYIGTFGITWVLAIVNHSSTTFHEAYEELRPCFLITDKEYSQIISKWFRIFSSHKENLKAIFFLALFAIWAVYVTLYNPQFLATINSNSLKEIFPLSWYQPEHKLIKAIIISIWGIFVAFPLGTAARLLFYNFFFLLQLRKLPVIPIPSTIKTRLQKINDLYIFIASTWFVGVGLFGILLFDKLDIISIVYLGVLSAFGTLTFLTPQFVYRQLLIQSHKVASQWILYSFYSDLNIKLNEKQFTKIPTEIGSKLARMDDLKGFVEVSKQSDLWVYDLRDFSFLLIGQVVSFGSVYVQSFIKALFP